MDSITRKREQEKRVVSEMIALYCHKHHGAKHGLCDDCAALEEYACAQPQRSLSIYGDENLLRQLPCTLL